jgi:hypothetical protein
MAFPKEEQQYASTVEESAYCLTPQMPQKWHGDLFILPFNIGLR